MLNNSSSDRKIRRRYSRERIFQCLGYLDGAPIPPIPPDPFPTHQLPKNTKTVDTKINPRQTMKECTNKLRITLKFA